MPMNRDTARGILRNYMKPRNWAITVFAQRDQLELQSRLEFEIKRELKLKREELETLKGDHESEPTIKLEIEELDHILTWLKLRKATSRVGT